MKHIKWLASRTQVHSGRVRGSDKNHDSVGYMGDCPVLAGLVSGGFVSTQRVKWVVLRRWTRVRSSLKSIVLLSKTLPKRVLMWAIDWPISNL